MHSFFYNTSLQSERELRKWKKKNESSFPNHLENFFISRIKVTEIYISLQGNAVEHLKEPLKVLLIVTQEDME